MTGAAPRALPPWAWVAGLCGATMLLLVLGRMLG
jgi:hypothetical protein